MLKTSPPPAHNHSTKMFTMNILLHLFALSMLLLSIEASRTCPRGCDCLDKDLVTKCNQSAQLDYVPHTLNPAVKELHLPRNNIRGIKSAFEVYKNLVYLDLSTNSIQFLGEKNFIANSKIETILLKKNNISVINHNTFTGLISMKILDLSSNRLETLNGSVFQNLKSLILLDLSYNNLQILSDNVFLGLNNLKYLNISNNFVAKFSSVLFKNVPNLMNLNASYNELEHISKEEFSFLNKLTNLDLSNCQISIIDRLAFFGLTKLTVMYLHNNNLKAIPSSSFLNNNGLQILYIGQNPFQMIPSKSFYNLKHLKILHISNSSLLSDINNDAFNGLNNLEMLELSNNEQLQHIGRSMFDNLLSLSSLILSNNNFTYLEIDLITRYKKYDLYLDVRGNPLNCNCSLEWLNFHLIRMFNKTISVNRDYFLGNNITFSPYNLDDLLNNNYSDIIISQNALDVNCASPFALENKLIIKLHKDKFGCFVLESLIPIIIGGLIGLLIIAGVIVLIIIRCKFQLSGFVKNQFYAENSRNDLDLYQKPDFIFVPNVDYNYRFYGRNRIPEDLSVHYPLKTTPTTEL